MRIEGASIPFPTSACCGPKAPSPLDRSLGAPQTNEARFENVARLVGATVPGRVTFGPIDAVAPAAAVQLYRHPADKNAAATAVHAGRLVDLTA